MNSIKGIKNTYRKTEIRTFKSQVCHETTEMHSQLQGQGRPIFCKPYLNLTSEASESDVNLKSIQPKLARGSLKPIIHYVFFSTLHWLLSPMLMKCNKSALSVPNAKSLALSAPTPSKNRLNRMDRIKTV